MTPALWIVLFLAAAAVAAWALSRRRGIAAPAERAEMEAPEAAAAPIPAPSLEVPAETETEAGAGAEPGPGPGPGTAAEAETGPGTETGAAAETGPGAELVTDAGPGLVAVPAPEPAKPAAETAPEPAKPAVEAAPEPAKPAVEAAPEPAKPAAETASEPAKPAVEAAPEPAKPAAAKAPAEPSEPSASPPAVVPLPRARPKAKAAPTKPQLVEIPPEPVDERTRMRKGLARTRKGFVARLARLLRGKPKVDEDLRDEVEEILFTADIGPATAQALLDRVTEVLDRDEVADPQAVWGVIRGAMLEILDVRQAPAKVPAEPPPYVLLAIGVNGVGKTTTLGKLAAMHVRAGRKVLLVAGDTFRAAAVEQLGVWARKVGCDLHAGPEKADPSSVIFEGITRARTEGHDVVLCDTAGRLHTRKELMDELGKLGRAATKALRRGREDAAPPGPHDIFLVLDATIGQNALAQAKLFQETLPFTGIVVTKLDGTAKGGVVLGICNEMKVPIRYIGIGEGEDDLRPFAPEPFVEALIGAADRGEIS